MITIEDRPETQYLTGMRAIAALFVFLIHSGGLGLRDLGPAASNFVDSAKFGVAIFFVISAYCLCLITQEAWNGARVNWAAFYVRRVFRIVPMYFTALFAAAGLLLLRGNAPADLGWSLLSHVTFWNILDTPHAHDIFVEWTVVVEVAFYAIFPFVLLLARKIRWGILALALLFSWRAVRMTLLAAIGGAWGANFYFTLPFHIYAFLFGMAAYVAVRKRPWNRWASEVIAWGSLAYMLWSMTAPDDNINEVPITWATAGIIVGCANPEVLLARFLRWRPLLILGTISFSIYLVHFLVLSLAPPGTLWAASALAMTLAISMLTFAFIEQPCREFGRRMARSLQARNGATALVSEPSPIS